MYVYLTEVLHDEVYKKISEEFDITDDISLCDIAISRTIKIDRDFMDKAINLKCIAAHGTGVDMIDLAEAKRRGIIVFNAPKQNALGVAELNVGLMLAISRNLDVALSNVNEGIMDLARLKGDEITGKTVGFIGFGDIAYKTAMILKYGFDMNVIYYNRTHKDNEFEKCDLDYVLDNSDYLIMGLALNADTRYFMDYKKLSKMKKGSYIINTTRGAIIDHDSLVKALAEGIIKGYATDVFESEPVDINDELFKYNVIGTPHIGGNTNDSLYRVGMTMLNDMLNYKNNKKIEHIIE